MMAEPKESRLNLRWAVIIAVLLMSIAYCMSRPLKDVWDSLRDRHSRAYLPLRLWMSMPFTFFMFAVLSAILTSFSGFRNWLKTFLFLCGFKAIFAGVTVMSLYRIEGISLADAAWQATFLSLPFVLIHILLSGLAVMFFRESFAERAVEDALPSPYFAGVELEERQVLLEPVRPSVSPKISLPERRAPVGTLSLPVRALLSSFPESELAMSPREIEKLSPSVAIPFDVILPQLPEGAVEVEVLRAICDVPRQVFRRSPEEVARRFPDGKFELPLSEIVPRVPPEIFEPPEQKLQPEVDDEFPDPFREAVTPPALKPAEKVARAVEETITPAFEELVEAEAPLREAPAEVTTVSDRALVLTEEERLLLEQAEHFVELRLESLVSQLPDGSLRESETPALPETVVVPLELIVPQLPRGELNLQAKYILAQLPEDSLSFSQEDIIRCLPDGELELPLHEVVQQLPPKTFAPPDQTPQPNLEDMPDPFRETVPPRPLAEEVAPAPAEEGVAPVSMAATSTPSDRARPYLESEAPEEGLALRRPPAQEVSPEPTTVTTPKERPAAASYAEMLQDENPLFLSVDTMVALLPEGSFRVSAEESKRRLGGETIKLPRRMVKWQLKEARVFVPVEILTMQFPPEHFGMSLEQIKADFTEGEVELPLREIVEQVLDEIAQPPEVQRLQPECEEISTFFHEIPQEKPAPEPTPPVSHGLKPVEVEPRLEPLAEETPVEEAPAPGPEPPPQAAHTILQSLLQECRGLGLSGYVCLTEGDHSVLVLAPSGIDREAVGCGTIEIMGQMRNLCEDYGLGEPYKLVVACGGGTLVCGELVRGEAARLILLASLNRSGAGVMSLVLDRFDSKLCRLSSLMERGWDMTAIACPSIAGQPDSLRAAARRCPVKKTDGVPEEVCNEIVAALAPVGAEHCLFAETDFGQKLVAIWGEISLHSQVLEEAEWFPENRPLAEGIFDIQRLSQYCSEAGLGAFESLLLVTEEAKVTLDRSPADPAAYLLCFLSGTYGDGLVRAKARKAVSLLGA